jgi:hypothetical protein
MEYAPALTPAQSSHPGADAEPNDHPWALAEAQALAGRSCGQLGAFGTAVSLFESALRWSRLTGAADTSVDLLCELVETLAEQAQEQETRRNGSGRGARDRARDHIFEAAKLAGHVADPRWEVTVLLRLSDVLDRFGDRDDAVRLQVRALQLTVQSHHDDPAPTAGEPSATRH